MTIDGAAVPVEALASPRFLDPGPHGVVATTPNGGAADAKVDLKEGEARDVALTLVFAGGTAGARPADGAQAAPIEATKVEDDAHPGRTQRLAGIVVGGVGVLALGAGGVIGLLAKSADDSASTEAFPAKHDDSLNASHLAQGATVVVGVGAAVAVVGAVLWFTAPSAKASVGSNGRELLLRGTF